MSETLGLLAPGPGRGTGVCLIRKRRIWRRWGRFERRKKMPVQLVRRNGIAENVTLRAGGQRWNPLSQEPFRLGVVRVLERWLPHSYCCHYPMVLVRRNEGFVVCDCLSCGRSAPLYRGLFKEISESVALSCPRCGCYMNGAPWGARYGFVCRLCTEFLPLADFCAPIPL